MAAPRVLNKSRVLPTPPAPRGSIAGSSPALTPAPKPRGSIAGEAVGPVQSSEPRRALDALYAEPWPGSAIEPQVRAAIRINMKRRKARAAGG